MTDTRDTGEHFLAPAWVEDDADASKASARRIADLTLQIDFFDKEVARYRELLERDRIRHATEIAELQLASDTRADNLRREERAQTQSLHDSYRSLLAERQLEFEAALTTSATENSEQLAKERMRFEEILEHERSRRDAALDANRRQTIDEVNQHHHRARRALQTELGQARETIERLEGKLAGFADRVALAEELAQTAELARVEADKALHTALADHQKRVDELESQTERANRRLETERQRSAATLSELLERSASIAAEADKARSAFAAEQAKTEHHAAMERLRAEKDYAELADAADERASRALAREADLEAVIAELRNQ